MFGLFKINYLLVLVKLQLLCSLNLQCIYRDIHTTPTCKDLDGCLLVKPVFYLKGRRRKVPRILMTLWQY